MSIDIPAIVNDYVNGMQTKDIAIKYNISKQIIRKYVNMFKICGGVNRCSGSQTIINVPTIYAVQTNTPNNVTFCKSSPIVNKFLFQRDNYTCGYCGKDYPQHRRILTRDHIIPSSKGGSNDWLNLVTACRRCNSFKADNLLQTMQNMKLLFEPYQPTKAEFLIMTNRNIRIEQYQYLSTNIRESSRQKIKIPL